MMPMIASEQENVTKENKTESNYKVTIIILAHLSQKLRTSCCDQMFWAKLRKIMYTPVKPSFTL